MSARTTIAVDRHGRPQIADDEVQVTVTVQVRERRAIADHLTGQTPVLARIREREVALVAEGQVLLVPRGCAAIELPLGIELRSQRLAFDLQSAAEGLDLALEVGLEGVVRRPVREVGVHTTVAVEVRQLDRPGPVRARQPGQESDLHEARGASVTKHGVAHVLTRLGARQEPARVVHVPHHQLRPIVRRRRHVRRDQIRPPVFVEIRGRGAHREPRRVRERRGRYVSKGPVAQVVKQPVGGEVVVPDVEIGKAVRVVVPEGRRQASAEMRHACLLGDVGEPPCAIVPIQAIELPRLADVALNLTLNRRLDDFVGLLEAGFDLHPPRDPSRARHVESGPWVEPVRHQVEVEISIAVVVREAAHHAGAGEREPALSRALVEGPVAAIDVQPVRRVVVADIEIEIPVAVDVREGRPGPPCVLQVEASRTRHVLELELTALDVERAGSRAPREEEVRSPIAIDVPDGDATTGEAVLEEMPARMLPVEVTGEVHTGVPRVELLEQRLRGRLLPGTPGGERQSDDAPR